MEYELKGDKLVITVNVGAKAIKDARPSATGKSKIVAGSGGFIALQNGLKFSLNVITKSVRTGRGLPTHETS